MAETAAYMLFRVALNQITEQAEDQYGMFDPRKANKEAGALVLQRADEYLKAYPGGAYVDSVQGLQRRVNWYLSDWPRLALLYEGEIATFADINTEAEMGGNEGLDELAGAALGKDNAHGRLKYYQQTIADPLAEPEDKTYALYRAVMCFSPSGYNSCDRQEIALQTRQRWFNLLKTKYKGNQWEQKLKYYW